MLAAAPAHAQLAAMRAALGLPASAGVTAPVTGTVTAVTPTMSQIMARHAAYEARVTQAAGLVAQANAAARAAAQAATQAVRDGLGPGGLQPAVTEPTRSADSATGLTVWQGASMPGQVQNGANFDVTINQTESRALLSWNSFDIGHNTTLTFNQQGHSDWVAVNRVVGGIDPVTGLLDPARGPTPSQILGSIKADGDVYVLNRAGVMFGATAQVNLHSLLASSLELGSASVPTSSGTRALSLQERNNAYLGKGLIPEAVSGLVASVANEQHAGVSVAAGAQINAKGGYIIIAAPNVSSAGELKTSVGGQVSLQAGTQIDANVSTGAQGSIDPNVRGLVLTSLGGGTVNVSGSIDAPQGYISLGTDLAGSVAMSGVLTSTTSVSRNGKISLTGGTVDIAPGAAIAIRPDTGAETIPQSADSVAAFKTSQIEIGSHYYASSGGRITGSETIGLTELLPAQITIGSGATIQAPSARVSIGGAADGPTRVAGQVPGLTQAKVEIQDNVVIDVSGVADYLLPATRNMLEISPAKRNELRDTPNYRETTADGSFTLNGATLFIDPRLSGVRDDGVAWIGSPLIEAASLAGQIGVTAQELMTKGGNVTLNTLGLAMPPGSGTLIPSVRVDDSAVIDLAGGWVRYQDGFVRYSKLVTADGRIVDIAQADPNERYVAIGNGFVEQLPQLAAPTIYANNLLQGGTFIQGYAEGRDAGALTIKAPTGELNATLHGEAVAGARQIADARAPSETSALAGDVRKLQASNGELPSAGLLHIQSLPGADIVVGTPSASASANTILLDDAKLNAANLGGISLQTSGAVTFAAGSNLNLAAGGALNIDAGRTITFNGDVNAAGGSIAARTHGILLGSLFDASDDLPGDGILKTNDVPRLFDVVVNPGATLSTRGRWTNDLLATDGNFLGSAYTSGGSISLTVAPHVVAYDSSGQRAIDLSGSIRLENGSLLDVSGGGYVSSTGVLSLSGKGGNVSLINPTTYFQLDSFPQGITTTLFGTDLFRSDLTTFQVTRDVEHQPAVVPETINATVEINGEIRSFGFKGGGTFSLVTPDLKFGSSGGDGTAISLDFLQRTGFGTLDLTAWNTALIDNVFANGIARKTALLGTEQVQIRAGETLNLTQSILPSLLTTAQVNFARGLASGTDISRLATFAPTNTLGDYDNLAANLILGGLTELDLLGGSIIGAPGASITVPKLFNDGTIRIAGGTISQRQLLPFSYVGPRAAIGVHVVTDQDGIDRGAGLSAIFGPANADGKFSETANNALGLTGPGDLVLSNRDLVARPGADRQIYYLGLLDADQGIVLGQNSVTDLSGISIRNPRTPVFSDGTQIANGRLIGGGAIRAADLYAPPSAIDLFGKPGLADEYYRNGTGLITPSAARPALRIDAEEGARIDLSGAADTYDIQTGTTATPTPVWSDAGILSALGGGDISGAVINATGGAPQAFGGTIEWRDPVLVQQAGSGSPPDTLSADQIMTSGFDRLIARGRLSAIGDVDLALDRSFLLRAPDYSGASLQTIGSSSGDTKPYADPYYAISIGATGKLSITAPHISLIGIDQVINSLTDTGSGSLELHGGAIDIGGAIAFRNSLRSVLLDAASDIRLIGVQSLARTLTPTTAVDDPSLSGQLVAGGDLLLRASQVYATTGSGNLQRLVESNGAEVVRPFLIASAGSDATIRIEGNGTATPAIPYSAGSYISVRAPHIEQAGVLRAPLGRIDLGSTTITSQRNPSNATDFGATKTLAFEPGSITSVSAGNLTIPYGTTTDLTEYYFSPTVSSPLTAPPAAELRLAGDAIDVANGATIDGSGGGNLYAYEFVSGTGGSRDVLSRFNSDSFSTRNGFQYADGRQVYAILPAGDSSTSSLYDPLYSGDYASLYGSEAGKTVRLEGAPGIPAGDYVLLPAQYALLPGAMRIVENVGATAPLGGSAQLLDGSIIVGGVYGEAGTSFVQSQRRAFTVQTQDVFRKYSRIELTSATTDFTRLAEHNNVLAPRLPSDAARIVINPLKTLAIGDRFDTEAGEGGRGSQIDISGEIIDIVAPGMTAGEGRVALSTDDIGNLNAASLLIGGIRTDNPDGSTDLKITAHEINVRNDAANPLTAPEIVLAVDGLHSALNIADGASIVATGALNDTRSGDYNVASFTRDSGGNIVADNSGAGSLVRVANGVERLVNRSGDLAAGATTQTVTLTIGEANFAGEALAIDTSRNLKFDAGASVDIRNIAISGDNVAFSSRTYGIVGLVITPELEQVLSTADRLSVRANGTLGFTSGAHNFNDLNLDVPGIRLLRTGSVKPDAPLEVTINARDMRLSNSAADSGACRGIGSFSCGTTDNSLIINTNSFTFGSGTFHNYGFDSAINISASSGAYYDGVGVFDFGAAPLTITTPFLVDRGTGAIPKEGSVQPDLEIKTSNTVAIRAPQAPDAPSPIGSLAPGARLAIGALAAPVQQVTVDGALLRATAGTIDINTANNIAVTGGATLATPSYAQTFGDVADPVRVTAGGGTINLVALGLASNSGNIDIDAGATLAIGGTVGKAGRLNLLASRGMIDLSGTIDATAPDAGASLAFDSGLGAFDLLGFVDQQGAQFTGDLSIRTGEGDLAMSAGQVLRLGSLDLTADGGQTQIAGRIDTSDINGGAIALYGRDGVTLASTAVLDAHANGYADTDTRRAKAGDVTLGVGDTGAITVAQGAAIDLTARRTGNRLVAEQRTDPRTLNEVTAYTFVEADQGGTLTLRAPVVNSNGGNTVNIGFGGTVAGARDITIEGYRHTDLATIAADSRFTGVSIANGVATLDLGASATGKDNFLSDLAPGSLVDFIQNFDISASRSGLGSLPGLANYHERPGIELSYDGDIVLASNWNLGAGTVDMNAVNTALAAGDGAVRASPLGGFEVVPGREAEFFQRFVNLTYRVGGRADGEAGRLTLRAGRNLDINHSITDGFFAFSDQTNPDYINYQLGGGTRTFNPALSLQCGVDGANAIDCGEVLDWSEWLNANGGRSAPLPRQAINLTLTTLVRGDEQWAVTTAPYSAAANSPTATGLQPDGDGDPIGSAQLFPLLADGSAVDSFSLRLVGGAGAAPSANPLHIDRASGGSVIVSGESRYSVTATKATAQYGGPLQLRYDVSGGGTTFLNGDFLAALAAQTDLDATTLSEKLARVQFGQSSSKAAQFMRQELAAFAAEHPGEIQFFGTGRNPTAANANSFAASLGLLLQFFESTDANGLTLAQRFAANVANGSFGYAKPAALGLINPPGSSARVRTLVRTGTGSIEVAAARDIDLRNGAKASPLNEIGGNALGSASYAAQAGGTAIYTAGHIVAPTAGSARIAGTQNSLTIDPSAYALTGDLRDPYWVPDATGRLQTNPVYATGGGSIRLAAGQDVLGRRDVWSEAFNPNTPDAFTRNDIDHSPSGFDMIGTGDQRWRVGSIGIDDNGKAGFATNIRINAQQFSSGVGTLGGGDITIDAGRDVFELTTVLDTSVTTGDVSTSFGSMVFGGGDLAVTAGHDILGGRFDISTGVAAISAGRNIGSSGKMILIPLKGSIARNIQQENLPEIRLTDTQATLSAGGAITLGKVSALGVDTRDDGDDNTGWRIDQNALGYYTENSGITLSAGGNVALTGTATNFYRLNLINVGPYQGAVLPAALEVTTFNGNIDLGDLPTMLYPGARGQLSLLAGGTLTAPAIDLDDGDPSLLPGIFSSAQLDVTAPQPILSGRPFSLPVTLPDTTDAVRRLYHNSQNTHAGDPTPARIAVGGDLKDLTLFMAKQARISAGGDIINMMFVGQNNAASDITRIVAGRDITGTTAGATSTLSDNLNIRGRSVLQGNQFIIGGPGALYIEAGRDLGPFLNSTTIRDSRSGTGRQADYPGGILSVGNDFNPWLAAQSADIYAFFGVGKGMNLAGLRETYLNPANADALDGDLFEQNVDANGNKTPDRTRPIYAPMLIAWMQQNQADALLTTFGTTNVTAQQAYTAFAALPELTQRKFLLTSVYFNELAAPSRPDGNSYLQYVRGYRAVDTLFPTAFGYTENDLSGDSNGGTRVSTGNLDLRLAAIETTRGSDITILGPGGDAILGSVVRTSAQAARRAYQPTLLEGFDSTLAPNIFQRPTPNRGYTVPVLGIPIGYEGVLTLRGGAIRGFTDGDFRLNQSRLFSQQSGDIVLWSSNGDLNAGQGPKSAANVPPIVVRINPNGFAEVDSAGAVTGAGIAGFAGIRRRNSLTGALDLVDVLNDSDVAQAELLFAQNDLTEVVVNGKTYVRDLPSITLIAPVGTVDAGDAGVRAAGDIFVAAAQVSNADNFKVGGTAIGVPSGAAAPTPVTPNNAASAVTANVFRANQSSNFGDQRARIQVDVLGYYSQGDACSDPEGSSDPNCRN